MYTHTGRERTREREREVGREGGREGGRERERGREEKVRVSDMKHNVLLTLSIVMLGMDMLRRLNSCSNFCAAFVKLLGLPNLWCAVGEEEEESGGTETVREEVRVVVGALMGDKEMGCDF